MNRIEIDISELNNLILTIKMEKGIDFSNYAYSSLKRRIENFMQQSHFENIDKLIQKINKDNYFFDLFIENILVDTTELFRDPDFWKVLKLFILKRLNLTNNINIFIPECNSGEELYSLLIILKQLEIIDKVNVQLTSLSNLKLNRIRNAAIEIKKMDLNAANFDRFNENGNIFDFFTLKGSIAKLNPDLLQKVEFKQHNLFNDDITETYDLILYRNKTLYYNQKLKSDAFKILGKQIKTGGFIAVGIKETFDFHGIGQTYVTQNESERIYKKIK